PTRRCTVAVRLRIELVDVQCRDTEDVLVADTFYLMAVAMASDADKSALVTDPVKIKSGQTISFSGNDLAVFYADVADDAIVLGGLKAFEEDLAKDWPKKAEWVKQVLDGLPGSADLPS